MTDRGDTAAVAMPADLYDVDQLLGSWDPADELSYASTLDARTYAAAHAGGLRVPHDDETARVRALHDHGITRALSRHLAGQLGARGGPQPEGTVDVHPRALRVRPVDQRAERVAGPAVDVAGLEAHDRRGVQVGQVRGSDAPLTVGRQPQRPAAAEP